MRQAKHRRQERSAFAARNPSSPPLPTLGVLDMHGPSGFGGWGQEVRSRGSKAGAEVDNGESWGRDGRFVVMRFSAAAAPTREVPMPARRHPAHIGRRRRRVERCNAVAPPPRVTPNGHAPAWSGPAAARFPAPPRGPGEGGARARSGEFISRSLWRRLSGSEIDSGAQPRRSRAG